VRSTQLRGGLRLPLAVLVLRKHTVTLRLAEEELRLFISSQTTFQAGDRDKKQRISFRETSLESACLHL